MNTPNQNTKLPLNERNGEKDVKKNLYAAQNSQANQGTSQALKSSDGYATASRATEEQDVHEDEQSTGAASTSGQVGFEEFAIFMKNNWRGILTDMVSAGVTAYLAHSAKVRSGEVATKSKH